MQRNEYELLAALYHASVNPLLNTILVLQQEIPVVKQMDAQLAERNPALQASLACKKRALKCTLYSKIPLALSKCHIQRMSTNCLRHLYTHSHFFPNRSTFHEAFFSTASSCPSQTLISFDCLGNTFSSAKEFSAFKSAFAISSFSIA